MPQAARMRYRDPDETTTTWVMIFVLTSLLAHALLVLGIIIMSIYVPPTKLDLVTPQNPEVSLSLLPPPPAPSRPPPFMPTQPQQNVKPKNAPIVSDNDTNLTSQTQKSRNPDSIMPDVTGKPHGDSLVQSPNSPSTQKPQSATAPPQPKQPQEQKPQPNPQQPKPTQTQPQKSPPTQNPSTAKTPPPTPAQTPPKPVQYDPNGLPELPAINAAPMEQPATTAQSSQSAVPPPLMPQVAADLQGKAGLSGAPSPDAMATELGKYKAKVYRAVGGRWYPKVNNQLQVLPVGSVRIQYTIYSTGRVETRVLDGGSGTMMLLLSISRNSITEAAPFDPFSPALLKELGTDSYTDDFTFSVYGQ